MKTTLKHFLRNDILKENFSEPVVYFVTNSISFYMLSDKYEFLDAQIHNSASSWIQDVSQLQDILSGDLSAYTFEIDNSMLAKTMPWFLEGNVHIKKVKSWKLHQCDEVETLEDNVPQDIIKTLFISECGKFKSLKGNTASPETIYFTGYENDNQSYVSLIGEEEYIDGVIRIGFEAAGFVNKGGLGLLLANSLRSIEPPTENTPFSAALGIINSYLLNRTHSENIYECQQEMLAFEKFDLERFTQL